MGGPGAFRRLVVLRPTARATLIPVANLHPQLPAPLGVEEIDSASVAVYDFFPGATLKEIVGVYRAQEQLPPLGLVVRIIADAARVLHVAHEHQDPLGGTTGYVHGGLADSSLLMGFDGDVRVLDFGLRKFNRFASPEAAAGGPFTAKCDVFSLAAALHASVTGFEKDYAPVLSRAPSSAQFPPPSTVHPDATVELDSLVMRALFPDPDSRLGSALELADDLERILGAGLPAKEACATRLKQLFEERLDGFRNLVPRGSGEAAPPASSPPKPRASKPGLPAAPRKSGPQPKIPTGTQPEANPIGRRPTPAEVKAAFGNDDGLEDDKTIVGDPLPPPPPPPRPSISKRESGAKKKPAPPPLPDVPWEQGPLARQEEPQGVRTDAAVAVPAGGELAIEEVPTGLSRRASGQHAAYGGSTQAEKARAVGQELVDTGEIEPFDDPELDDLRDQPTVVRVSGTHQKLKVDPKPEEIAAAFGDPDAVQEPGTAIITSNDSPKAIAAAQPLEVPDTGVLEHNKKKEPDPTTEPKEPPLEKKKGGGGLRALIAVMLLVIVAGFGYVAVKNPALVKGKLEAAMVKWGLKKVDPPPPPPDEPGEPMPAADEDGGVAEVAAPPPVVAAEDAGAFVDAGTEDSGDAGEEEEEEDEDGGTITAGDAGTHADGGAIVKKKKKKKRRAKAWWQTK